MLLAHERHVLETYAPGLDQTLAEIGLERLENPELKLLPKLIKQANLPGLLVLEHLGGTGCNPYDAIRLQRAIASRSPSMGIMTTMHNFTISFCNLLADVLPAVSNMLQDVAQHKLLVASGFAEGRFGSGILDSTLTLTAVDGGYRLNGSKKPCTMSHCMDILTAGVSHIDAQGLRRTGMAILPSQQTGMSVHSFWNNPVLLASDSHELRLNHVFVPSDHVLIARGESQEELALIAMAEASGLCWFEIIATANYLGAVSGLAEKALANPKLDAHEVAALAGELETAQAALDGAVRLMETGPHDATLLPRILMIRFAIQATIERCAMRAAELAGGLMFVKNADVSTLLSASRCLAFHPISRKAAEPMIASLYASAS